MARPTRHDLQATASWISFMEWLPSAWTLYILEERNKSSGLAVTDRSDGLDGQPIFVAQVGDASQWHRHQRNIAMKPRSGCRLLVLLGLLGGIATSTPGAHGEEPAREFLAGLRERGYHDMALEYLQLMETSPLLRVDIRETILYEKGLTLIEGSRSIRDQAIREKNLADAKEMLEQFVANRSDHALANSARSQLGNLIVERARWKVESAKSGKNKEQLLNEAHASYEEAYKVFRDLEAAIKVQLERIPNVLDTNNKQQALMAERRTQLRADYLQTKLLAAAIREEMADTLAKDSEPYKKLLTEAADLYQGVYKDYRTRLAGLYARLYQGRANQKAGKLKDALGYYTELLDQPDEPEEFRRLKTQTLRLAMKGWLDPAEKKYVEAIKRGDDWIKKSRPTDDRDPDWLSIRMDLAKAYQMQADETKKSDPQDTRTVSNALADARRHAQFVAGKTSDFQEEAKQLVAVLGGPDRTGERPEIKNFNDAKTAGKDALDSIQTATLVVNQVPARIAQEQDAAAKAELEKQLGEAQQTLATAQRDAMQYYKLALSLRDEETDIEDVNIVRYFVCYLYYLQKDYYEAALLGDFIARRYPDSAGARQCGKIALACYMQIYSETQAADPAADMSFESERIVSIAEYIADKWSDQPEAEEALNTLVPFMINAGEFDKAKQFLVRLPEGSPRRRDAEMKTGQAFWGSYLRGMQKLHEMEQNGVPEGTTIEAERAKLDAPQASAHELLTAAYGRLDASVKPDRMFATAMLSYAQVLLEMQQVPKTIEVLEHPTLGPLTLVKNKDPAAQDPAFVEETYKTALRAYISSLGSTSDASGAVEKAKGIMDEMKIAVAGTPEGEKRLVSVYITLARDLEAQLKAAPPETKRALSQGFETFLNQLNAEATELSVLNWVAESFSNLGAGLDDGQTLNEDAKKYYLAALTAFQNILDKLKPEKAMQMQIQLRMANVMAKMRDYEKALAQFDQILTGSEMSLNIQVEACKLLETWARQPGQEEKYTQAMLGVPKAGSPRPIIWGWGKLANMASPSRNPNYADTFYEARLHLAQCRLLLAETKQGADRDKGLAAAEQDVVLTKRLFPELGGEKWLPQYDALLKKIQTAQNKPATGLQAIKAPAESAPAASGS